MRKLAEVFFISVGGLVVLGAVVYKLIDLSVDLACWLDDSSSNED